MTDALAIADGVEDYVSAARNRAVGSLDSDPEEAAQALKLAKSTGVPSTAIAGDLDGFVADQKAKATSDLVRGNPIIADYINSHPLAAQVSNGDLGNLDELSDSLKQFHSETALQKIHNALSFNRLGLGGVGEVAFPGDPLAHFKDNRNPDEKAKDAARDQWLQEGYPNLYHEARDIKALGELGLKTVTTPIVGALNILNQYFGRESAAMLEHEIMRGDIKASGTPHDLIEGYKAAQPWLKGDLEPPMGIHPKIDELKVNQAKVDVKALDDAIKGAVKTDTLERSPESIATFDRLHGDREIGISTEAIDKLYGDKPPTPDDNTLGWIPDLADRLESAKLFGGDVWVPSSDYISNVAKTNPELHDQLREHLRVRDSGITLDEAKTMEPKETIDEPLQQIRGSAGLEPMFSVGDRKLTLEKRAARPEDAEEPLTEGYRLLDENGKNVGWLEVKPSKDGKQLYVDNIGGFESKGFGPNSFGPALTRSLIRQLKEIYPQLEEIGGFRISGAREKAGTTGAATIKVEATDPLDAETHARFRSLLSQNWEDVGQGVSALFGMEGKGLAADSVMGQMVLSELRRLVPDAEADVAHGIETKKGPVRGVFIPYMRQIIVSLTSRDPIGTARHESIHALRNLGLISDKEWTTLEKAVDSEGWRTKYRVDERWGGYGLSSDKMVEEAVAEGYRNWANGAKASPEVHTVFEKIKAFFENLRQRMHDLLGIDRDLSWREIFEKIDSGEIGAREADTTTFGTGHFREFDDETAMQPSDVFRRAANENRQLSDKELRRLKSELTFQEFQQFQKELDEKIAARKAAKPEGEEPRFEPSDEGGEKPSGLYTRGQALGVTQSHMDRILREIEKRNENDTQASLRRAEVKHKRLSANEWKERRVAIRDQVREQLQQRPDIAANQFFATTKFKIHPDFLTPEQKALLPKDFIQKKDGVNPDELATHFGLASGDELIQRLALLSEDRKRSGMSARDYFNRLVDVETDRRLNREFGDQEQQQATILARAYEQALSENQLNLMHDETKAFAEKAGIDAPFDRAKVEAMVRNAVQKMGVKELDPVKLLQAAGRTAKKVSEAEVKGDYQGAYRLMQAREHATIAAKIAVDYKKQQQNLDRMFRTYAKVPTKETAQQIDQAYYNYIQETMTRVGQTIRRTKEGLDNALEKEGYASINDFVDWKSKMLRDLYMPDYLRDPKFSKSVDKMNYEEFQQLHNFIKRMDFNGRDEKSINISGQKADLAKTIDTIIERLPDSLSHKALRLDRPDNRAKESMKSWWWSFITLRSMAKRLDRGDPNGLLTRLIANTATAADASKSAIMREFVQKLKAVGKIPDMDKQVDNVLFKNPNNGEPLLFRKRNIYGMIGHWGNPSNRTKLVKGWDVDHDQAEEMLRRNTTPEDWDRHEQIGKIAAEAFSRADQMAHRVSGVGIEGLRLEPFIDPHGIQREGWYHPAQYEDMLPGKSQALLGANAIEREGMFRATTPQGYSKARSGYTAPLDLSLDALPMRIEQMIHDIAWRPAIIDMGKIIYNQKFQRAIISKFGKHQMEEFKSYLKDMAGGANVDSLAEWYRDNAFEYFRRNTVGTLIGLNPSTVLKHGITAGMNSLTQVGPINFAREFFGMARSGDEYANTQLQMAWNKSEVIQGRMQNIAQLIRGHDPRFSFEKGKFASWRETMMQLGSFPVALGDFATAVPTWLAEYKKQIANGIDEGPAVEAADRAVIEAHGSAMPSNQPSAMRTNSLGRMFTSLYGFFSHMLQKQYEFAWKAKDIWNGEKPLDIEGQWATPMMSNLWSYWIAPAIVEELITPYTNKEHESLGWKIGKAGLIGLSSSMAYVRDFARALIGPLNQPSAGLVGTSMQSAVDLARVVRKNDNLSKEDSAKIVRNAITLTGILTGLTNAQEGKSGEYIYRYLHNMERPKGPWDAAVGLRYGKTDKHSHSFKEWWNHMVGH